MGYADGFYYGQAILICLSDKDSDNGKAVTVNNGVSQWTKTITDRACKFILPGKDRYAVSVEGFSTNVELSYGECKEIYLSENYEFGTQGQLNHVKSDINGINSLLDDSESKLNAANVKVNASDKILTTATNNINCEGQEFTFKCDDDGEPGFLGRAGIQDFHYFHKQFTNAAFIGFKAVNNTAQITRMFVPDGEFFSQDEHGRIVLNKLAKNYFLVHVYLQKNSIVGLSYVVSLDKNGRTTEVQTTAYTYFQKNRIAFSEDWQDATGVALDFEIDQRYETTGDGEVVVAIINTGTFVYN